MRGIPSLITDIRKNVFTEVSILRGDRVIAIVAPAFIGQFSGQATPGKFMAAMKILGFLEKVPAEQNYMATSCCPAWHSMIQKLFPGEMEKMSMTLTPMAFTARMLKKYYPDCKVVFVGPCAAKKLEAIRETIRSDVDFVLTFEELMGMFQAKDIDFAAIEAKEDLDQGTSAVADLIHKEHPDMELKIAHAEGLRDCRKLMTLAKAGKYNGHLLEGMACPGGCVAGPGTILPVEKAAKFVDKYKKEAKSASPLDSAYREIGEELMEQHK